MAGLVQAHDTRGQGFGYLRCDAGQDMQTEMGLTPGLSQGGLRCQLPRSMGVLTMAKYASELRRCGT